MALVVKPATASRDHPTGDYSPSAPGYKLLPMEHFDLDGQDIGGRILDAVRRAAESGPVGLTCRGARFREDVQFEDITFGAFDATEAVFDHGLAISRATFVTDATFDRMKSSRCSLDVVRFRAAVYLRGGHVAALKMDNVSFEDYMTLDTTRFRQLTLRNVTCEAEARFRQVEVDDEATLRRVVFSSVASFEGSTWKSLRLLDCSVSGPAHFDRSFADEALSIVGCRMSDARNLQLRSGKRCELRETTFEQAINLRALAPEVNATSSSFENGLDLVLSPGAQLDLSGASLGGPSLITTAGTADADKPARLVSLDGTRLDQLTLRRLDLSACSFARAHALDDVVISGRGQLATAPPTGPWSGRREVLFDESDYRHAQELRRRPYGPARWYRPESPADSRDPATLSETYRALRRGRETARDRPGAADFYYGEMEMRRHAARSVPDRVILTAYWWISGYGLRASRPLAAYVALVIVLAVALQRWGLKSSAPFDSVLAYVLATTTVLARPATDLALDTFGSYLQVVARVLGPALVALTLLALRSRVTR